MLMLGKARMLQKFQPRSGIDLTLTFFRAPEKKDFSFFSCGVTPSRTGPKTQPLQVAFALRERVDLRSQKEGILGKRIAWGRVGRTGQKKEKRMHKKRWGHDLIDLRSMILLTMGSKGKILTLPLLSRRIL